ncbi:bifunctional diguanylate cyclase/phosphodiesterase [Allochromatium vinosum]|uniref:Diguanylate cyclase/phosphodiesterase n=1 Tax=Allochromatium vinosum (strain ATCC 17899 / DSM 180 / NBRC 103801 / NCIMB 10441 / D) TaxID=572477 RepID=D3RVV8_ALLVD|nr:diguanylate cyclase/phosphodiesterase [Allochromatium vinosum DSM 180]MBK1655801.1 bifunctional diguanylate cyclase/phosphodiesterase [Allochromatium vinosum]
MKPAPPPRSLSPAESVDELPSGTLPRLHPLTLNVLREVIARLHSCRSLSELLAGIERGARLLLPTTQMAVLLRQPDACLEIVHCAPHTATDSLGALVDDLIDRGHFGQALKQGFVWASAGPDRTCLLSRISTASRIHGLVLWVDPALSPPWHQTLGALTDLIGLGLERLNDDAEAVLLPRPATSARSRPALDIAIPVDRLTGLAHRTHFMRFLQRAILDSAPQLSVATLLLDVDGFHRVNRELSYETGDQILCELAARLNGALQSQSACDSLGVAERDICFARTGADEFGIALARVHHPQRLVELAAQLHSHIAAGFQQQGSRLHLSVSIGIAVASGLAESTSAQDLMRNADAALKRAKQAGRNRHVLYEPSWESSGTHHLRTESLLQEALRQDTFNLHFQPQFELATGRLAGAEVLLRLTLGDGTPLSPASFIPVAESTGQIIEIGEWVLRRACRQLRAWDALGLARIPLAINVSAIELSQPDLSIRLQSILEQEGIGMERLHLEITETAIAHNEGQTIANLKTLRAAGFEIWIDDFGTGYSSLKSIKNYPASGIKLDREFVKDLSEDHGARVVAAAILDLAWNLGYPVVAEGIEDAAQCALLRGQGCDIGQGFHLGHPVDALEFQRLYLSEAT